MKPTNKNPNEFIAQNELRKTNPDLTVNHKDGVVNLLTLASQIVKSSTADELLYAVNSVTNMGCLLANLQIKEEGNFDVNNAISKDQRMQYSIATLLDCGLNGCDFTETNLMLIKTAFLGTYNRACEILIQDIFYLASEYEAINYNIFETDEELPF